MSPRARRAGSAVVWRWLLAVGASGAAQACLVYDETLLQGGAGGQAGEGGSAGGAAGQGGAGAQGGGGAGGAGAAGGTGGAPQCTTPATCPGSDTDCRTRTCIDGVCGLEFAPAGTPSSPQTTGDCKERVCDGEGVAVDQADNADVPSDGKECTLDGCSGGSPTSTNKAAGTPCAQSGGKVCNSSGACVECVTGADCASAVCTQGNTCAPAACGDSVKNGAETDVDCGGPTCPDCAIGKNCLVASDCASASCVSNKCAASCFDGLVNQTESDVDCGGPCDPCNFGQDCNVASDCTSNFCSADKCACNPNFSNTLVISELRSRGAAGGSDDFVELYNPTASPITVDGTWTIEARSDSAGSYSVRYTGTGLVVPAHGHLLVGGSAYAGAVVKDALLSSGITDAASVVLKKAGAVIDAVCYHYSAGTQAALLGAGYVCEGASFPKTTGMSSVDTSLERLPGGAVGHCFDSGVSAADFHEITTPNPQNLASPPTP